MIIHLFPKRNGEQSITETKPSTHATFISTQDIASYEKLSKQNEAQTETAECKRNATRS